MRLWLWLRIVKRMLFFFACFHCNATRQNTARYGTAGRRIGNGSKEKPFPNSISNISRDREWSEPKNVTKPSSSYVLLQRDKNVATFETSASQECQISCSINFKLWGKCAGDSTRSTNSNLIKLTRKTKIMTNQIVDWRKMLRRGDEVWKFFS